jgi:hypothetical protein
MRFQELNEVSPPTFEGSLTIDLLKSKIWLCSALKNLGRNKFSSVYILGSWYGSMAVVLNQCQIKFDKIINVDIERNHIEISDRLLSALAIPSQHMLKDVNTLTYKQLDKDGLVINTSVNDIKGEKWFDRIPKGTLVALQSRNNADIDRYTSLKQLDQSFFLTDTLFLNEITLEDPETKYQRFMKIGVK